MKVDIKTKAGIPDNFLVLLLAQMKVIRKIIEARQSSTYFTMSIESLKKENVLLRSQLALAEKVLKTLSI